MSEPGKAVFLGYTSQDAEAARRLCDGLRAAGRLHDEAVARSAVSDLSAAVPGLNSLTAVRNWLYPQADLYGYEPLFEGLKLAGLHD